jgi:hypothetical protein
MGIIGVSDIGINRIPDTYDLILSKNSFASVFFGGGRQQVDWIDINNLGHNCPVIDLLQQGSGAIRHNGRSLSFALQE